jgi:hypothetical protein
MIRTIPTDYIDIMARVLTEVGIPYSFYTNEEIPELYTVEMDIVSPEMAFEVAIIYANRVRDLIES